MSSCEQHSEQGYKQNLILRLCVFMRVFVYYVVVCLNCIKWKTGEMKQHLCELCIFLWFLFVSGYEPFFLYLKSCEYKSKLCFTTCYGIIHCLYYVMTTMVFSFG